MSQNQNQREIVVVSALTQILNKTLSQNLSETNAQTSKKTYFNFYLNLPNEEILSASVQVESSMTVEEALNKALLEFQVVLFGKGLNLNTDVQNFIPRLAKKNKKPKIDMPCIDLKTKFGDIQLTASSIQIKNKSAITEINRMTVSMGSRISNQMTIDGNKKIETIGLEDYANSKKSKNCFFCFC